MGSLRFKLNSNDLISILKGALIAGAGAGLIYAVEAFVKLDFGVWTGVAVALGGILINIIRKWLADNSK